MFNQPEHALAEAGGRPTRPEMRADGSRVLFCCENIHIRLGGRQILEAVSLGVDAGQVLGIVGPNGAGKTTLLEIFSGRYRAQFGQVFYDGRDITRLPLYARARLGLGRTYQSPVVPEALKVGEVLKVARQAYPPLLTRYHAEWAADKVGLTASSDAMAASLDTLSRRKLLLACLLMRRPRVLLMDEPAAGLINSEIDEIDTLIRTFARELQMAVMVVEHRLELLSAIADEVAVLDLGRLIARGSPDTVFEDRAVRAAYFDAGSTPAPILESAL